MPETAVEPAIGLLSDTLFIAILVCHMRWRDAGPANLRSIELASALVRVLRALRAVSLVLYGLC